MFAKLASVLVAAILLLPGCFTTVGALTGAGIAHSNNTDIASRRAKGEPVPESEEWSTVNDAVGGGLVGLAVDLAIAVYAVDSAADALNAENGGGY